MKGDFSRNPYDPSADLTRILFQQGKPLVEGAINEAFSALLANQRKIIRLLRKDDTQPEGAFGNAFLIHEDQKQLQLEWGDYRFDDTLVTNSLTQNALSYRANRAGQDDRFVALFGNTQGDRIPKGVYLVSLAATERPLILGEIEDREPELATLQTSIPCIQDWEIVLELAAGEWVGSSDPNWPEFDQKIETIRTKVAERYPLDSPGPAPLIVAWQDPVAAKTRLSTELQHRLWRLEIHQLQVASDGKILVDLKFAIDNASELYHISEKPYGKSAQLSPSHVRARESKPRFEVERPDSWLDHPEELLELESSSPGVLKNSDAVAEEARQKKLLQVRRWDFFKKQVPLADLMTEQGYVFEAQTIHGHPFPALTIKSSEAVAARAATQLQWDQLQQEGKLTDVEKDRLNKELKATLLGIEKEFRVRDAWSFRTRDITQRRTIPGLRQAVYYAPLGVAEFGQDGKLVQVDRRSYRKSINITGGNLAKVDPPAPKSAPVAPPQIAAAISCHRAFPNVQSLAAKRWLASVTLGEIAGLSKDQLRQRIERDSLPKELDSPLLERDLNEIIARRQQVLSLPTIA